MDWKHNCKKAEDIKAFLKERKKLLVEKLVPGWPGNWNRWTNKLIIICAATGMNTNRYWEWPEEDRKPLELLSKTKLWKGFLWKNSICASLFRIPDPDAPVDMADPAGLQTMVQVNTLIQKSDLPQVALTLNKHYEKQNLRQRSHKNWMKWRIRYWKSGGGSSDGDAGRL